MTVHDLLDQHSNSQSKLSVRLLPPEKSERAGYVLVEGDKSAIRFLGELLIEIARQSAGYDLQLHPSGPGSLHFQDTSDLGFYIQLTEHREDGDQAEVRKS
jgi:hypothetical protein